LEYEFKDKKPKLYQELKDSFNSIKDYRMHQLIVVFVKIILTGQVPLQDNYSDCGLYLLEYAERFLTNPYDIVDNLKVNNSYRGYNFQDTRDFLNKFPLSPLKNKREDIKKIIFGLAKGNKDVLKEYLAERKRRLEEAQQNPEQGFSHLDENEVREYLKIKFGADYNELDVRTKDKVKLTYFVQCQEQKLKPLPMMNGYFM